MKQYTADTGRCMYVLSHDSYAIVPQILEHPRSLPKKPTTIHSIDELHFCILRSPGQLNSDPKVPPEHPATPYPTHLGLLVPTQFM
jgi:hypothetical protein